jgi:glutamate synthase domain-containing protein 2
MLQSRHTILRNFPLIGHLRWIFESIRPEIQQYFIERDFDGRPFDRDVRSTVYEQAKDAHEEYPFGTDLDVYAAGYEWFQHSIAAKPAPEDEFRVSVGGPDCAWPYSMARLNISAMSYGSLSAPAILALNKGAKLGGFAHDTGEGGISEHHLRYEGDLVWEIGSAYFGCRTTDGRFDADQFERKAAAQSVKCISIKLSQGAKPGLGGVMPEAKVTEDIARVRGVPVGVKCVSPPSHGMFTTPRGLLEFVRELRQLSGGKPTGFKLCVGRRSEFLGICKAMLETKISPDFILVDGGEGGTGAAPLEFENHVGMPLTEGLMFVHNALVGCGLRDHIRIGCSGKIATGFAMAKAVALGADYCNSARGMMFALGCIQARRCHSNRCPTGVTTHDPTLTRGLVVGDKASRVCNFQRNTVRSFQQIVCSLGLDCPEELGPEHLMCRIDPTTIHSYAQLHRSLEPGELTGAHVPQDWEAPWRRSSADSFG